METKRTKQFNEGLNVAVKRTVQDTGRKASDLRPFVCDGNVFDCKVFVVGVNPVSNVEWDPLWDRKTGKFDKLGWLKPSETEKISKKKSKARRRFLKEVQHA